jgi:repressor LexA
MQGESTQNVNLIISRLKSALKIESDKELSDNLGVKPNVISNWKKRGSIDYKLLFAVCESNGISIDSIVGLKSTDSSQIVNEPEGEYGIPLIPLDAAAGFSSGDDKAILHSDVDFYSVPEFNKKADYLIRVSGSSMYPKYNSGDIVACKKLPLDTFFQWNKVYILDTIQGPLMKRVKRAQDKDFITLVSDNEKYDPFDILRTEIHSLALVIGVIRLE